MAFLCLLPAPARAVDYYVNDAIFDASDSWTTAAGNDLNTGLSPSSPKRTITAALALAAVGDRIFVDAGTFAETIVVPAASIEIRGVDSGLTILDRGDSSAGTAGNGIAATGVASLLLQDLQVRNSWIGCSFVNVDNATIRNVAFRFLGNRGIVLSAGSDGNTIETCAVERVSNVGVELTASSSNRLRGCLIADNASRGLEVRSSSDSNEIVSNAVLRNNADGIYVFQSTRNRVAHNLVRNNALDGLEADGATGNLFVQNLSDSNAGWQIRITNASGTDTFAKNALRPSPHFPARGARNDATDTLFDLRRNWWGTIDSAAIRALIDTAGADSVSYIPFRLGELDSAPGADTVAPRAPDTVAVVDSGARRLVVAWAPVTASEEPEAAVGLAGYRVWRSRTSDTTLWVAVATAGPAATSVEDSGLDPETTYFYRVTAFDAAPFPNESFFSDSIASGTTSESAPPSAFLLVQPAQGVETTAAQVLFSWTNSVDDTSPPVTYTLRRSTVATFASFVDSAVGTETSAIVDFGAASETVFWRVIASDAAGNTTVAGDSLLVRDTEPPNPFALLSPADSANTRSAIVAFAWAAATDTHTAVVSYLFRLSTSPTLSPLLIDSSTGTATNTSVALPAGETYFWNVTAFDRLGNARASSETRSVIVETVPPTSFRLLDPPQNHETSATAVRLSWTDSFDSQSAVTYVIRRSNVPTFSTFVDSAVGANTSAVLPLAGSDSVFWRVIASDAAGNTTVAGDSVYLIDTVAPAAFTLASPANGANTSVVNPFLAWNASSDLHSGINRYRVQVTTFPDFFVLVVDSSAGLATSLQVSLAANATYIWRVIAIDDVGNTTASTDTRTFTIETGAPNPFRLVEPAQGHETTATSIRFSWTDSSDTENPSLTYTLRRSTVATFATFVDAAAGANTTVVISLAGSETIFWRVIATDGAGNTTTAGDSSFVLDTAPPSVPALVAPIGGETRLSPVALDWNASTDLHSGFLRYRVQVSTLSSFAAPIVDGFQATQDTTVALPGATYFWRVYAEDDVGNSVAATADTFVVPDTFAPTIVFFRTSPESPVTTLSTTTVEGAITSAETPPAVSIRRIGPATTTDTTIPLAAGGTFSAIFPLETVGDSTTTIFALTVVDLGGDVSRDTIALTRVGGVLSTTVSESVASASAVFADSEGASVGVKQGGARSVSISLAPETGAADSVEIRIDFADGFRFGAVVVRRPDRSLVDDDTVLAEGLHTESAGILSRYLLEVLVHDSAGLPVGSSTDPYLLDSATRRGIRIVFRYREADFGVNEPNLKVHFYDEAAGRWTPVADSDGLALLDLGLDQPHDTIGYLVRHLTIFAPIPSGVGAAANLDEVVVFPNPFIPYDGNPRTGSPVTGIPTATDATGIRIANITSDATVTIYDIHGRKVDELANLPNQGLAIWDARDSSGREVASGTYVIVVRDRQGRTAVRKVAIIR